MSSALTTRSQLIAHPSYLGNATVNGAAWHTAYHWETKSFINRLIAYPQSSADVDPSMLIAIGKILPDQLSADPIGNYKPIYRSSLSKSRFVAVLGPGEHELLASDFDAQRRNLTRVQSAIAGHHTPKHLLTTDGNIRISGRIFEELPTAHPDPDMDNYPVPDELHLAFDAIKSKFGLSAFTVFDQNGEYVSPINWRKVLLGATVQVTFDLFGYSPLDRGAPVGPNQVGDFTFTADVRQIKVLTPAPPPNRRQRHRVPVNLFPGPTPYDDKGKGRSNLHDAMGPRLGQYNIFAPTPPLQVDIHGSTSSPSSPIKSTDDPTITSANLVGALTDAPQGSPPASMSPTIEASSHTNVVPSADSINLDNVQEPITPVHESRSSTASDDSGTKEILPESDSESDVVVDGGSRKRTRNANAPRNQKRTKR